MPRNKFWVKSIAFTLFVLIIGMSSINITSKTIEKRNDASILESSIPYPFKDPPNEVWNKTFGGDDRDYGRFVQQTSDNGYIIIGETKSYGVGNLDIWLIKTDIDGNELWNKTFGGPYDDWSSCIRETTDGGFIIVGSHISSPDNDAPWDTWLIKTDENGNMLWNKIFIRTAAKSSGTFIIELDGGYLVMASLFFTGPTGGTNIWLIKTDFNGIELWNKTIGSNGKDFGNAAIQTIEGDFLITGHYYYEDVLLIKTDSNGNILWRKTLDGREGFDIKECEDSGYIIAGREYVCLIRTDKDGNMLWKKEYQGEAFDRARSVDITSDGGFIVSGIGTDIWGQGELLIIKTDGNGNREWEKLIGGPGSDSGSSVIQSNDDTYVIAGSFYRSGHWDAWLVKVAPFENQRPSKPALDGPTSGRPFNEYTYSVSATEPDGESLFYWFEWGDNTYTPWQGPFESGENCATSKIWLKRDSFTISVKARDIYGGDSDWATLEVTIQRNKPVNSPLFLIFLERFPILQKLLLLIN